MNEPRKKKHRWSAELALTRNALSNLYHALDRETVGGHVPERSVNVWFAMSEAKKVLEEKHGQED